MMVMTAKVDLKKVLFILGAVVIVILGLIMLLGGKNDTASTAAPVMSNNDARVKFLLDQGWDVTTSPTESSQVRIPQKGNEVFNRYNQLQKSQGYDLTQYAGKNVMRYVYKVNNYPGATEPVYATILVYKNQIIGGDITDTAANGQIRGIKKADMAKPDAAAEPVKPSEATAPTEPVPSVKPNA